MKSRLMHGWLIVVLALLVVTPGCDDEEDIFDSRPIEQFDWDTSGGGDLHFFVVRADPDDGENPDFRITVTQRGFQPVEMQIDLRPDDGDAHALVADIFERRLDIRDYTFTPKGPTGTWTSIVLRYENGESETIDNVKVQSVLGQLYSFVDDAVE